MKLCAFIFAALNLIVHLAAAEQPLPGLYRGVITISRSNSAFSLRDVTTLFISAEIYNNGTTPSILWTARNFDASSRLQNLWADHALNYATLPQQIPDIELGGQKVIIPGGPTVPGSFKMTARSLAWKCTSVGSSTNVLRNVTFSSSFSITRIGPSPASDN